MNEEEIKNKQNNSAASNEENSKISSFQQMNQTPQGETIQETKDSEGSKQLNPYPSSINLGTKIVMSQDKQKQNIVEGKQVWNTEGSGDRRKQQRKYSHLIQPSLTEKSTDEIHVNSTKATKKKIEYDVVKQFLVKAYSEQCVEEGEMELISMPTKRSTTRKSRKKTPIKVESIYKEELKKRQISDTYNYTIIDNKKKRQEIKLKQRLIRDFSMDANSIEQDGITDTINSYDQIPPKQLHQKSQSFHHQSKNDLSQTNLNSSSIQPIQEEPDTIIVEDTYPLEWDPGFNKKARKKLELINQSRSNNTLPLLDLSNVKNLEKYRSILKSKQGWQPLLNTPFLPISPSNQVKKADLFKNLLKEKKAKYSKSKTPLKSGSRLRGRLISLQNEWGKYNQENNNLSEILNTENVIIHEEKDGDEGEENGNDKTRQNTLQIMTRPKSMQNKINNNSTRHRMINNLPSKVTEVEESNYTSEMKSYRNQKQIQNQQEDLDEIDLINERIDEMMTKIPQQNKNQQIQNPSLLSIQVKTRDIKTASRVRTANQGIGTAIPSKRAVRYTTLENQTVNNFYKSGDKIIKQNYLNPAELQNGVSRSHEFYDSISNYNLSIQNNKKNHNLNSLNTLNSQNIVNYSDYNQDIQPINFDFVNQSFSKSQNQEEILSKIEDNQSNQQQNQGKEISFSNNQIPSPKQQNIKVNQDTVKIGAFKPKRLDNEQKKRIMYISYQDQKMLTEGNVQDVVNPDLQETIKVQEMMIQEQKLKQQLSILRSQGDRVSRLDKSCYKESDDFSDVSRRITPARFDGRKEQRSKSRNNYSSLTPMNSSNKMNNFSVSYYNNNIKNNQNHINSSFNTLSNQNLNQSSINTDSINQNTININNPYNNNNGTINQNHQYISSSINVQNKTNRQLLNQQYNTLNGPQSRSPISGKSLQNQYNRASSKSPINSKTIAVKDSLSPHQRIYIQQGNLSNQVLSCKIQTSKNNLNPKQSNNFIENKEQQQTFSTNMNSTDNNLKFDQEISEEQEAQIAQLKLQFDDIIRQSFAKPKKINQKQRRYVQQSII